MPTDHRWSHHEVLHAWWVEPGAVLAGEYPGDRDPVKAAEKINLLVDAGIRTFVDLTTPADGLKPYAGQLDAVAAAREVDLRRHNAGIPDLGVIGDDGYDHLIELIDEEKQRGGVYIHCWGGVGRTGTVVGCLLARQGLDYQGILDRLKVLRANTTKSTRPCPETDAQLEVIRRCATGA